MRASATIFAELSLEPGRPGEAVRNARRRHWARKPPASTASTLSDPITGRAVRSITTTDAPALEKSFVVARPIPDAPPLTTVTVPSRRNRVSRDEAELSKYARRRLQWMRSIKAGTCAGSALSDPSHPIERQQVLDDLSDPRLRQTFE